MAQVVVTPVARLFFIHPIFIALGLEARNIVGIIGVSVQPVFIRAIPHFIFAAGPDEISGRIHDDGRRWVFYLDSKAINRYH